MDYNYTFNCNGKVNSNDWTLHNKNLILHQGFNTILCTARDDYCPNFNNSVSQNLLDWVVPYATGLSDLKHLVDCIKLKINQLCRYEKFNEFTSSTSIYNLDFYQLRHSICECIVYVCTYLDSIKWNFNFLKSIELESVLNELFNTIRKFITRIYRLPDTLFHYAAFNRGNECTHPGYHIYHLHLEMRWLFIAMIYSRHSSQKLPIENEDIDNVIKLVISDLIYLAVQIFTTRISSTELRLKTPFICTCAREIWLMLQLFVNYLNEQGFSKTFWDYVNTGINELILKNNSNAIFRIKFNEEKVMDLKNPEIFSIWLIFHVNLLHGYRRDGSYINFDTTRVKSNHAQVEKCLKSLFNKCMKGGEKEYTDKELCAIIPMLNILINEWWESDVRIIKVLLDYFQSKINQQFLLQSFGPWCTTFDHKTPGDILKEVRDRIEGSSEQTKESSYGLFLRLIGIFLQKNRLQNEFKFWKQIKGRIYSKFQMNKVQELSEDGLYNFLSLFLTLAICADTADVCSKILDISINFGDEAFTKKTSLIWKVKLAVLLLYKDLRCDFKDLKMEERKENLLSQVNQMSCTNHASSMMKHFVDVLHVILISSENLDKNEHILIDGWIDRYLLVCSKNTMILLIDTLHNVFEKCNKLELKNHPILEALWNHVASRVRQMVLDANLNECYRNIAKLAVTFTIEALKNSGTAERYKHSATSLFQHFTTSIMIKDAKLIQVYLANILSNDNAVKCLRQKLTKFDHIIIQVWLKCCVLTGEVESEESKFIKNYIISFKDMQEIFVSSSKAHLFRNSDSPFGHFLTCLAERRNLLKTEHELMAFDVKYRSYFQNIDKWALVPITKNNVDSELSCRIYKCLSILIFHCGAMFYLKNQPQNMLKSIITAFLLPSEDKSYLHYLGTKIFSMVILGFEHLNVDFNIQVLLHNLIDCYLPLLITETSVGFKVQEALLNCFTDAKDHYVQLILEKIANFIVVPSENTTHKHCYLVMILLKSLAQIGNKISNKVIELMIHICIPRIISCYMKVHDMHPHKQQTIDFIKAVIQNIHYVNSYTIRNNLINVLWANVQKHLTVNSQSTFQFLHSLLPITAEIVMQILPKLQNIILECEKNKRPNAASLRYSLRGLTDLLINQKSAL